MSDNPAWTDCDICRGSGNSCEYCPTGHRANNEDFWYCVSCERPPTCKKCGGTGRILREDLNDEQFKKDLQKLDDDKDYNQL